MLFSNPVVKIIPVLLTLCNLASQAQVKITDGSVITMNPGSLLELESTNKGILIPRFAINNLNLPSPLTLPVPEAMLVYSIGGAVPDGFYYWNGSCWINILGKGASSIQTFTINSNVILLKTNCLIFASNDITLTLPEVSVSDTGLIITVKNTGSHTHLVNVKGYGSATIENQDTIEILPGLLFSFVARGTDWLLLNGENYNDDIIDIGPDESFQTLSHAIDFLNIHMDKPMVLRIGGETEYISNTILIDLPYSLTIQGSSYGVGSIAAATGLAGKAMFRCRTESYFKMLTFDATTLAGYGTNANEDAIRLVGSDTYNEIKDCTFGGFYNAIVDSSNAELWLFECDITDAQNCGLLVHSDLPGVKIRISETDFMLCGKGIHLSKGSSANFQLTSGVFTNSATGDALVYDPAGFSFISLIIMNCSWNNSGNGITGFDFTRADGRDANAYIENNPGMSSNKPHCKINVVNNTSSITCTNSNNWYKANWTNTSSITTNIQIANNRITYQPATPRDLTIFISGNVLVNGTNRVITVAFVRNGNSSVRYGETTLRVTAANQPFQFSTVIYLEDVSQNDYFELFCSTTNSGDVLIFQDINWFVTSE